MNKYFIRERWNIGGNIETYTEEDTLANIVKDLKAVKKWIKNWIEIWKENAEENDYKFLGFKTDYKTFCRLRINRNGIIDYFTLKVIKPIRSKK